MKSDRRHRSPGVLLLAFLASMYAACDACKKDEEIKMAPPVIPRKAERSWVTLEMGGRKVRLETALTTDERQVGMMWRKRLDQDKGMLFVYPEPQYMSFWMLNTKIPLSIAFIKEDGTVVTIYNKMEPESTQPRYVSDEPCRLAIEMNAGWFEARGIKPGDRIILTREILELEAER